MKSICVVSRLAKGLFVRTGPLRPPIVMAGLVLLALFAAPHAKGIQPQDVAVSESESDSKSSSDRSSKSSSKSDSESPSPHIVVVVGAGGTPEYAKNFADWADVWNEVAEQSNATITLVGQASESDSTDREQLGEAIKNISGDHPTPAWIVFLGHGTFGRNVAKFNLRGPDVSATELAAWLAPVKRTVVVVNCASTSGPFVNRLSGPNRVIVTATRSGTEQSYARFGKYFAEAISSSDSDLDHDDEVSVHEAFLRASAGVRQFYESEARISTEHALIDDNGDGRGTPAKMFRGIRPNAVAKDAAKLDGRIASRITLSPAENRLSLTADELKQRQKIEAQLDQLRLTKDASSDAQYEAKLEPLMIRLAKIYQAAEKRAEEK